MRTFHIAARGLAYCGGQPVEANPMVVLKTPNMRVVTTCAGELIVWRAARRVIIADDHGRERERHKVPYGAT